MVWSSSNVNPVCTETESGVSARLLSNNSSRQKLEYSTSDRSNSDKADYGESGLVWSKRVSK